jgi:hypothetical protein
LYKIGIQEDNEEASLLGAGEENKNSKNIRFNKHDKPPNPCRHEIGRQTGVAGAVKSPARWCEQGRLPPPHHLTPDKEMGKDWKERCACTTRVKIENLPVEVAHTNMQTEMQTKDADRVTQNNADGDANQNTAGHPPLIQMQHPMSSLLRGGKREIVIESGVRSEARRIPKGLRRRASLHSSAFCASSLRFASNLGGREAHRGERIGFGKELGFDLL